MNRKLRFSWGHIVAFLALIFIAYVVFMGATYYTVGNYCAGLFTMGCCVLLIVLTVLGAQVLKGVDKKFHRSIIWERILVACSPFIIIIVVVVAIIFCFQNRLIVLVESNHIIVIVRKIVIEPIQHIFIRAGVGFA